MRARIAFLGALALLNWPVAVCAAAKETVASGKTQVVARASGREITISEMRAEMARLGLSPSDPGAEQTAIDTLVNRTVLAAAAREANLHRRPEALARMQAAQEQALADLYLGLAAQAPEPTRDEIADYIKDNPSLFSERRTYDFLVMNMEASAFDEKSLTPLFDTDTDFKRLAALLDRAGAKYAISTLTQSGLAFPKPIRDQLGAYDLRDNIVLQGEAQTRILKIAAIRPDPAPQAEWGMLSRRILMEEAAARRAGALIERLRREAQTQVFRTPPATAAAAVPFDNQGSNNQGTNSQGPNSQSVVRPTPASGAPSSQPQQGKSN